MVRVRVMGHGSGRVDLQKARVESRVNPFLLRVKKVGFGSYIFRVGSKNSDLFCHVYLFYKTADIHFIHKQKRKKKNYIYALYRCNDEFQLLNTTTTFKT